MRKKVVQGMAALMVLFLLAGCTANNASTAATGTSGAAESDTAATGTSGADAADTGTSEAGTEIQTFLVPDAYLASVDVSEYVTLGDYKELEVTVPETTIEDEDIESVLEYYTSQLAVPVDVTDRALREGDTAQLDYSGRIKETDEVFEGGTATGQTLEIGSGSFIDGFEDGMVGMEIGETRELELTFPDPYYNNPDLAGVPVIFTVTLNGIQEPGEVTDETVKELGIEDVETVDQLRAFLEKYMREDAEAETLAAVEDAAVGMAVENAEFTGTLPEKVMERYIYIMERSAELQAASQGLTAEELISQTLLIEGYEGEAKDYIRERAEEQVKELLVYEAIARAEDLGPTEKELTEGIAEVLLQTGFESVEQYEEEQGLLLQESYKENLMALAAREFLAEHAKVTYE